MIINVWGWGTLSHHLWNISKCVKPSNISGINKTGLKPFICCLFTFIIFFVLFLKIILYFHVKMPFTVFSIFFPISAVLSVFLYHGELATSFMWISCTRGALPGVSDTKIIPNIIVERLEPRGMCMWNIHNSLALHNLSTIKCRGQSSVLVT